MLFTIQTVFITLTLSDGSTEQFELEAPTAVSDQPFVYGYRRIELRNSYRDRNLIFRRGSEYYQFFCRLSYEWHKMDLRNLLVAKSINLRIPPSFTATEGYQSFDCRLANDEVVKNWFRGLVMNAALEDGESGKEFIRIPSGPISLEFVGTKPFTPAEFINESIWHEPLAPYPPKNIALVDQGSTTITVSWDEHKGPGLEGFNVYANGVKNNSSLITKEDFESNGFQHQLTGLSGETLYEIKATAVDEDGFESVKSSGVTTTTESIVGPVIWIRYNFSDLQVVETDTGDDGAFNYDSGDGIFDGGGVLLTLDANNNYVYTIGGAEDIRQLDYDPNTGEIFTPHNWEQGGAINFATYFQELDANGDLIYGAYSRDLAEDHAIIKVRGSDGAELWHSDQGSSLCGVKPHPNGILVAAGTDSNTVNVLDPDNGNLIDSFQLKDTGGSVVSGGRIVWIDVDKNGFIFVSKSDDPGSGLYRIDPSDYSTTHFLSINSGAGALSIGSDYMFVARADDFNPQNNGGRIVKCDDLTVAQSGINCLAPDIFSSSHNQFPIRMDLSDNAYWVDSSNTSDLTKQDVSGNILWTKTLPNRVDGIYTPPGTAYPFL